VFEPSRAYQQTLSVREVHKTKSDLSPRFYFIISFSTERRLPKTLSVTTNKNKNTPSAFWWWRFEMGRAERGKIVRIPFSQPLITSL
jgi:hypothetical protein